MLLRTYTVVGELINEIAIFLNFYYADEIKPGAVDYCFNFSRRRRDDVDDGNDLLNVYSPAHGFKRSHRFPPLVRAAAHHDSHEHERDNQ